MRDWPETEPGCVASVRLCVVAECLSRVPVGQELLREMEGLAENGNWGDLETALQRVQGPPNDAATNLRYAAICRTPTPLLQANTLIVHARAWLLNMEVSSPFLHNNL